MASLDHPWRPGREICRDGTGRLIAVGREILNKLRTGGGPSAEARRRMVRSATCRRVRILVGTRASAGLGRKKTFTWQPARWHHRFKVASTAKQYSNGKAVVDGFVEVLSQMTKKAPAGRLLFCGQYVTGTTWRGRRDRDRCLTRVDERKSCAQLGSIVVHVSIALSAGTPERAVAWRPRFDRAGG